MDIKNIIKPGMYISFRWKWTKEFYPKNTVIAKVDSVSESLITTSKKLYEWRDSPFMEGGSNGYFFSKMTDIKILTIKEVQQYLKDSDPDRIHNFEIGDYVILLEDYANLKKGEVYRTLAYQALGYSHVVVDHKGSQSYLAPSCSKVRKATTKELHERVCKNNFFKPEEKTEEVKIVIPQNRNKIKI